MKNVIRDLTPPIAWRFLSRAKAGFNRTATRVQLEAMLAKMAALEADCRDQRTAMTTRLEGTLAELAAAKIELEDYRSRYTATATQLEGKHAELAAIKAELQEIGARLDRSMTSLRAVRLPSICLAALPKSAGLYIYSTLLKGLYFDSYELTNGVFPDDQIMWTRWTQFAEGNKAAHNHLEGSPTNLWYIKTFGMRLVVHVRDPRAVLLSWIHHLSPARREAEVLPHPVIAPPDEYYDKPLRWKIDWMIDNHLEVFVRWIERWLDAELAHPDTMLVMRYEDFLHDRVGFLNQILDFYGIPRSRFHDPRLPLVRELNFRTGQVNEWRDVFDKHQRQRASSAIPPRLFERFGWNPNSGQHEVILRPIQSAMTTSTD
jgi:Sulfotransferase domain